MSRFLSFLLVLFATVEARAARDASCENLLDAAKFHLRQNLKLPLDVLKGAAFVEAFIHPDLDVSMEGRSGLIVNAAGQAPLVFAKTQPGGELVSPTEFEDGPRVYIDNKPILSVVKGQWAWTDGVGPEPQDPNLRTFLNSHFNKVTDLMREEGYTAKDIADSEVHPFELDGKPSWLLRLPLRLGQTEDRFRDLWIFRGRKSAMPISELLSSFKPNAKIFRVNTHLLYREIKDGQSRYGFVNGDRLAQAETLIEDMDLRGLWRTRRKHLERLLIQPQPLAVDELLKAKAIDAYADEPGRHKYIVIVREGQEPAGYVHYAVGMIDEERKWPHLAEDFQRPRTLLSPDGRRVKTSWENDGLRLHIYDPNGERYRLEGVRVFSVGEDWFLERLGRVRRWTTK